MVAFALTRLSFPCLPLVPVGFRDFVLGGKRGGHAYGKMKQNGDWDKDI